MQPTATGNKSTSNGGGSDLNHHHHQPPPPPPPQYWTPYHPHQWMPQVGMPPHPAMAMHHHQQQQQQMMMMMYPPPPPHFMPYVNYGGRYYQQQQQPYYNQKQQQGEVSQKVEVVVKSGSGYEDDVKTVWIGDLLPWMDENYLQNCFASAGELVSVKVIRNKQTGQSDKYGFVEFLSRAEAEKVLQTYPGTIMPNTKQPFRLNWATFSSFERRSNPDFDLSVFVGDLAPEVTDTILQETFASKFKSIKGVKVVLDLNTGRSKGYGFVRFGDETEKLRAVTEMDGAFCLNRPMRVGVATPKRSPGYQRCPSQASVASPENGHHSTPPHGYQSDSDTNRTIFVGGVDAETTEEDIRQPFSQFGEIISLKMPVAKGCAFVQFAERSSAEDAIQSLNGTAIGNKIVRLAWGRTPANKLWRNNQQHWNGGLNWEQSYKGQGHSTPQRQDHNVYTAPGATQTDES